ncbi:MAG: hypothetical protein EOP62_04390 [Sphingomonadales bacterium]|nr:MAG: hypothetical protein EOP62_04390 [Sphingomonadales bacterium]
MLSDLKQAHEELLGYISELEAVIAKNEINASNIARVRLQLSKASSRRRRIVAEAIQRLSEGATSEETRRLNLLRENDSVILAATSSHVGEWSIEAILADSEGYRAASNAMRKSMRERIAMEKTVLYPPLERADPPRG